MPWEGESRCRRTRGDSRIALRLLESLDRGPALSKRSCLKVKSEVTATRDKSGWHDFAEAAIEPTVQMGPGSRRPDRFGRPHPTRRAPAFRFATPSTRL